VHRLSREEVLFPPVGSAIQFIPPDLPVPDLSFYKPDIDLKGGQLSGTPPATRPELNARTILRGGTLTATSLDGNVGKPHATWHGADEAWAGSIIWTQDIQTADPRLTRFKFDILDWGTGNQTPITLKPVARTVDDVTQWVIQLKIANLCETNPLEWVEFQHRLQQHDVDFKWLFRLFDSTNKVKHPKLVDAVGGPGRKFPYPRLKNRPPRTTGSTGCTGGQFGLP
jgi:hypothetical protein